MVFVSNVKTKYSGKIKKGDFKLSAKEKLIEIILNNCCYLTQGNAEFDVQKLASSILQEIPKLVECDEVKIEDFLLGCRLALGGNFDIWSYESQKLIGIDCDQLAYAIVSNFSAWLKIKE